MQSLRGEDSLPTRLPPARVLSPPACRRPCCIVLAAGFARSCGRLVLPSFAACGTGRPSSLTIRRLQSSSARAPPTAPLTSDAPTRCMHCSASSGTWPTQASSWRPRQGEHEPEASWRRSQPHERASGADGEHDGKRDRMPIQVNIISFGGILRDRTILMVF